MMSKCCFALQMQHLDVSTIEIPTVHQQVSQLAVLVSLATSGGMNSHLGASINDVRENIRFLDPPPPVTYMITQLISTVVHFSTTPYPPPHPPSSMDIIDGSPLESVHFFCV